MPGPWFVDFENGLTTNSGLSALSPWKFTHGQAGFTTQTNSNLLAPGDVIYHRKGTSTNLRINITIANLSYLGYGTGATNGITLQVPTDIFGVYRSVPLDGFWVVDGSAIEAFGALATNNRANIVIEDVKIIGCAVPNSARHILTAGDSAGLGSGFTIRRFYLTSGTARGLSLTGNTNCLVEYGRIEYTQDDSITIAASTGNSFRAGSLDILRYLELIEPNMSSAISGDIGNAGDFIHFQPSSGNYEGSCIVEYIRGVKSTQAKQAIVLQNTSSLSSMSFKGLDFDGGGDMQILTGHIKGKVSIRNVLAKNYVIENLPFIRFDPADSLPKSYFLDTGSELLIDNVHAIGANTAGFLRTTTNAAQGNYTMDGYLGVTNCSCFGQNVNSLSSSATVAITYPVNTTLPGPNFKLRLNNNVFPVYGDKPNLITPAGIDMSIHSNIWGSGNFIHNGVGYSNIASYNSASGNTRGYPPVVNTSLGTNPSSILVHSF
jgi:hypothetical protein